MSFFQIIFALPTQKLQSISSKSVFIAKENAHVLCQKGDINKRFSPCSTFKIAISLMGYDDGILIDEQNPTLPYQKNYVDWRVQWMQAHNPSLWITNSCVWYSQFITKKLGFENFKNYISKFDYGNQDVCGDKGKNNGITMSWLSSSLKISALEQVCFLQKLVADKLPVSLRAHAMTKNLMFLEDWSDGWKFYGKTGAGYFVKDAFNRNKRLDYAWFVGWVQKENRIIVFAHYIENSKQEVAINKKVKTEAMDKLQQIIKEH